ncbi:hypothetical protein GT037_009200 [Alternaria burnsii]|uniref:Heterokaryon incompatibility domain-containing protein n=1 Tax=Alternaria burnsii TaxID=1187904 RepID=A0A8H7AWP4_9PLEO|nr:uncharacterized protein GT037_009200 [Alternaria burnsii]KAF7672699.1 hypothetical protein GT037_009200 [Alternaria burnsii]
MSSHITACCPAQYEPLDPALKEIRVLEVAPASGDGIVECTMSPISLLDNPVPVYETISYCWGPPRAPSTIKLNGRLTPVPASSEAAIRRMRLSDRPRTLWIDAICIDQSSVTERSAQVAFMSTVYRAGMRNLVYLGEDDGMAERGVKAVQDVVADMRTATNDLTMLAQTIFVEHTGEHLTSDEGFSEDIDFEALEVFFSLEWFRRLWVLQEIVLATSNTCYWGNFEFDLLVTVRTASWINYKRRFVPHSLLNRAGYYCAFEMFDHLDRDNGRFANYRHMAAMLDTAQRFEKTEDRDGIYAILGLIDQDKALEGHEAALLEVDYTKPIPDVLRDATRYALSERNDLEVLTRLAHDVDMLADFQTFPTWTVRADVQDRSRNAFYLPYVYNSSEGLEAPSLLSDTSFGKNVLLLQGIVVDQVVQTTIICDYSTWWDDEKYFQWLVSIKHMTTGHNDIAMLDNVDLAIADTLAAGQTRSRKKAQPDDLKVLVGYIESLTIREDGIVSDGVSIKSHVDKKEMRAALESVYTYWCQGRRLFVTAAGRTGLGPRCMQPEDIVVVLRGGLSPFILRKKVDGYQLIGQAYVHGIMYGEAVELDRSRGKSEVVFHVR